ncbi:insulin receptor substrate 1 [Plakobranchus ocellatus]|uniref:Insulin receptor substrate 1 n=1 Tax=Plakobranchus ocellatus TaxID=259542 RepID=A0AAV4AD23_9GAST|nr:insulin receptor substrate 1 [Plakobranchus ocellatus]
MDADRMSVSSMGVRHLFERPGSDIRKTGFLKKLKSHRPQTLKKKYFVLRSTSASGPARLEYYDSEKKFKSGSPPKRSIQLHTCFNINRRSDSSIHQHGGSSSSSSGKNFRNGLVLYMSDESFTVVAESEEEMEAWLTMLLEYQNEYLPDGDMHREHYGK